MDDIEYETSVNIHDIQACITAIQDGNSSVAEEILQEYLDTYHEELEDGAE